MKQMKCQVQICVKTQGQIYDGGFQTSYRAKTYPEDAQWFPNGRNDEARRPRLDRYSCFCVPDSGLRIDRLFARHAKNQEKKERAKLGPCLPPGRIRLT